ncbi:hypothetical protein E4T50_12296 [Aureobasidium sp. EXF-12298]|nr:hypothetical protein E4T50_12296 [Aureobasidium sp. EXF-12298]KAI4755585.1 hypothetical protein E4T51_11331 [Aureobasidium sp. EXF-12344]KAI4772699.1 hypothetical protein E4T52_12325 [Aureobasidium sp. EXF-3400]
MYHHANTNINPSQSTDHDSKSTKSSELRRREIPLAFTNTHWGKEFDPTIRRGSRFRNEPDPKVNRVASVSMPSRKTSEMESAKQSTDSSSTNTVPFAASTPAASSQEYSVMAAWNFFRRTFPQTTSPTSPTTSATEQRLSICPQHEETIGMGPWLEMLMRWDDFEQWRLKMLERPWCWAATP